MIGKELEPVLVVADGHVHFHDCFEVDEFLESAYRNLRLGMAKVPNSTGASVVYALMFTECFDEHFFASTKARVIEGGNGVPIAPGCAWHVHATNEERSLWARNSDGREILLVAGCQVAAEEDLEVLLLGTTERPHDHQPIRNVLSTQSERDCIRVIPWGFGKWFFSRGRLLDDLVAEFASSSLFLGDESGRPSFWPYPAHFSRAAVRGVQNLPGTDPLPFAHEVRKVGRMGFALSVALDRDKPAGAIVAALTRKTELQYFATMEPTLMFIKNQALMQLRKRLK